MDSVAKNIPCRYLKGSKSTRVPAKIIGLACTFKPSVRLTISGHTTMWPMHMAYFAGGDKQGCIACGDYINSTSRESLFTFVLKSLDPKHTNYLVSANLGRDLSMLAFWLEVETGRFTFDGGQKEIVDLATGKSRLSNARHGTLVISDTPTIISGWYNGVKVVMVDIRNYGIADEVEGNILTDDYATLDVGKMSSADSSELAAMGRAADNYDLFTAICNLVLEHDMGILRHTYSSQAIECYKHRFMTHKILLHHNESAQELEGRAIFGVPSVAYYKGEYRGKVYKLDVCGLYPSVMRDNLFPVKLIAHSIMTSDGYEPELADGSIAVVRVCTGVKTYPYRQIDNKCVIYPVGKYLTVLTGKELSDVVYNGRLNAYGTVLTYDMAPIFTDYVDYWWRIRQCAKNECNTLDENWAKLMLVSLWGKFGQKAIGWELDESVKSPIQWGMFWQQCRLPKEPTLFRAINWRPYRRVNKGFSRESFPAIAAFVCMYARRRMDQLKEICGARNVLLQIADCLYVTARGRELLEDAKEVRAEELGYLRECAESDGISIQSSGDYCYAGEEVISGVKIGSVKVGDTKYVEIHEAKLPFILTGDPAAGVPIYEILKTINRVDPPGRIGSDGWIDPPIVEEW